jgi:hypothetical protein
MSEAHVGRAAPLGAGDAEAEDAITARTSITTIETTIIRFLFMSLSLSLHTCLPMHTGYVQWRSGASAVPPRLGEEPT